MAKGRIETEMALTALILGWFGSELIMFEVGIVFKALA